MSRKIDFRELQILAEASKEELWILANGKNRDVKIYLHWSAGHYQQIFEEYHLNICGNGDLIASTDNFAKILAHTYCRNTGAVGISLCCAYLATPADLGLEPPTIQQITTLTTVIAILAKVLDLTRPSLQKFLKEKGYIIAGFNDKLPLAPADKIGHATITQTMPTDSQLSQQVADLKAQLASAGDKIDSQAELIAELKEQLASIEQASNDTQSDTPADNELLTAIYDDSKPYLYAPELHNAIEVWKLIYHDNLTSQHLTTHSDKFESAIKQLGITFANNAPKERLKQITTPQQQKEKTKPKNS